MAKSGKRGRGGADKYDSDDGFVEKNSPVTKKRKSESESNTYWEISSGKQPRRIEISEFKGAKLVNIREFYQKDGEYLPGKKGISLNIEQYKAFIQAVPDINAHLEKLGVELESSADKHETKTESKPSKLNREKDGVKKKKKVDKANIDATSDENEDEEE